MTHTDKTPSTKNTKQNQPTDKLKIIFAGTPDFAANSLQALIDNAEKNHYELVGVYSQPDRPAGRGQKLLTSPVKQLALDNSIPVFQPVNFKQSTDTEQLEALNADIMIVAAYGIILPKIVLDIPRLGCINVHASLLPRWRGAAPIHRALIAGDKKTGITIMQMDVGLDTGDMLLKAECEISNQDTSGALHDRLSDLGGTTLVTALEGLKEGVLLAERQDDNEANYASKLTKAEGKVDWSLSAKELDLKIRGLCPWPGSYVETEEGVLKIHEARVISDDEYIHHSLQDDLSANNLFPGRVLAIQKEQIIVATGEGALGIRQIQFPGAKRLQVKEALNGKFKNVFHVGEAIDAINKEAK